MWLSVIGIPEYLNAAKMCPTSKSLGLLFARYNQEANGRHSGDVLSSKMYVSIKSKSRCFVELYMRSAGLTDFV